MSLTNEIIQLKLTEKFGEQLVNFQEPYGMLTFEAPKEINLKVLQFLFDDEVLQFKFMTDLCAVHYPDNIGNELAIVYHLHNLVDNIRIRFKYILRENPKNNLPHNDFATTEINSPSNSRILLSCDSPTGI